MAGRAPVQRAHASQRTTSSATGNGINRKLFNSELSRRPTTSSSADTVQLSTEANSRYATESGYGSDIVEKDEHGNTVVEQPVQMPSGDEDEAEEDSEPQLDARLLDMYRNHSRQLVDSAELKAAMEVSLRKKVASLDDDKWKYEVEDDSEVHP